MGVIVRFLAEDEILSNLDRIVAIYRAAFQPPPYRKGPDEVVDFALTLPGQLGDPGFRFAAAFEENSPQMVGFTYGRTALPGQYWYDVVRAHLAGAGKAGWIENCFQVVEMAVHPAWQGKGAGGKLHDSLLEDVPHPRAALTTLDGQTPAASLYEGRGWVLLAGGLRVPALPRAYKVMGLTLPRQL